MNYVNVIAKILEKPQQTVFNNEVSVTQFMAEVPKLENEKFKTIIRIAIWDHPSMNVAKYFFIGDYILIEGYISLRDNIFTKNFNAKQIEISVFKVDPFVFY